MVQLFPDFILHTKKPRALSVAGGLASSCMEGIAHAGRLAAVGFFVFCFGLFFAASVRTFAARAGRLARPGRSAFVHVFVFEGKRRACHDFTRLRLSFLSF